MGLHQRSEHPPLGLLDDDARRIDQEDFLVRRRDDVIEVPFAVRDGPVIDDTAIPLKVLP
jgi:hypothetical protein